MSIDVEMGHGEVKCTIFRQGLESGVWSPDAQGQACES